MTSKSKWTVVIDLKYIIKIWILISIISVEHLCPVQSSSCAIVEVWHLSVHHGCRSGHWIFDFIHINWLTAWSFKRMHTVHNSVSARFDTASRWSPIADRLGIHGRIWYLTCIFCRLNSECDWTKHGWLGWLKCQAMYYGRWQIIIVRKTSLWEPVVQFCKPDSDSKI